MYNKKVLITGGSGFIGSHLTKKVLESAGKVCVLTKYKSIIDNVRLSDIWDDIEVIEADIRNLDSLRQIKDFKPDIVFHLAAYNHVGDSFIHVSESLDVNSRGTANLFEAYTEFEKFVYISTSETYGYQKEVPFKENMLPFPISPYSVGKYSGELYCRMKHHVNNLPIICVKPFNAFGPYQSAKAIIPELIIKFLRNEEVKTTEGVQTREFNYVENLVEGFILAANNEKVVGEVVNLGCGLDISIKDLAIKIHEFCESSSELNIGALNYRPTEIWKMSADNLKAKELLGWEPKIDLDEGLKITIDWYRKFIDHFLTINKRLF